MRLRALLTVLVLLLVVPVTADAAVSASPASGPLAVLSILLISFAVLTGTGIVPTGAVGTELTAVTRRAFVPRVPVQIYKATAILSAALANAQTASGGVSSVTVPVQGSPFVQAQATDYTGAFNQPAVQTGITEADFNLKAVIVPIPFLGMEGILQMNAAVIPLIEARMNDAGNQIADYLATQQMSNGTYGTINVDGFPLIASTSRTYGNISSASPNTWWNANVMGSAGTVAPTRKLINQMVVSATKAAGGEAPNIGVCGPGTWALLANDFIGSETYFITPGSSFDQSAQGARASFTALMVAGVPIYQDLYMPEGQFIFFNTRYYSFYIHEAAAFAFTGFASTLPNFALGYVGALIVVLEGICVKPSTFTSQAGYTNLVV